MEFMDTRGGQEYTSKVPYYLKSIADNLERIANSLETITKNPQQPQCKDAESPQK